MTDLRDYTISQFSALIEATQRRTARTRIATVVDTLAGSRGLPEHFKQHLAALEAATHG
jgi:hypothetical protein